MSLNAGPLSREPGHGRKSFSHRNVLVWQWPLALSIFNWSCNTINSLFHSKINRCYWHNPSTFPLNIVQCGNFILQKNHENKQTVPAYLLCYQTPTLIPKLWIKVFLIYLSWQSLPLFFLSPVISNWSIYMHSRPAVTNAWKSPVRTD